MQQTVVVVGPSSSTGPTVRVDSCPRCRRPLHLAHVGAVDEDGEFVDLGAVVFAQSLHYRSCRG